MCIAGVDMLFTIPLALYNICINVTSDDVHPWVSWSNVHSHFSTIDVYPASVWRRDPALETSLELQRWMFLIPSLVFFAVFGFVDEARHNYRAAFLHIVGWLGYARTSSAIPNRYLPLLNCLSN